MVFHTAGIRVVKPFTEVCLLLFQPLGFCSSSSDRLSSGLQEVVEDLKWEQVLRWSVNEDEQSFRFFVESRSTSALINHTYETDEVCCARDSAQPNGKATIAHHPRLMWYRSRRSATWWPSSQTAKAATKVESSRATASRLPPRIIADLHPPCPRSATPSKVYTHISRLLCSACCVPR